MNIMKFELQPLDWYKRRAPSKEPVALSVEVTGFEKVHNHKCELRVSYDDGVVRDLIGRVLHNTLKDHWTINGLNANGFVVSVKVIE